MVQVLIQDVIRQHVDRIEPACVADLFALADAGLSGTLAVDLTQWASRAAREIRDLPAGEARAACVAEISEMPAEQVPHGLRTAVLGLPAQADIADAIEALRASWEGVEPAPVKLPAAAAKAPVQAATIAPGATASGAKRAATTAATRAPRVVKTPASMVDPRRAEWIREDAVTRLNSREYVERGLKESILVAGIRHRSPYKDLTEEEVKAELRKLERERKLKHTGERWLAR
jgi:hypothetical protein